MKTKWRTAAPLAGLLLLVGAGGLEAQERGWEPVVTEEQRAAYEATRYAPAVRIGDMLIASGVIGVAREGDNGPEAQFRRAFERMIDILAANDLTLGDVAEMTTYHVNLGELGRDFIRVKDEYLPEPPYPAWTAVGVDRLFLESALIEIRFTAALRPGW